MSYVNYDDLVEEHGVIKTIELFEVFRDNKPTQAISPDFAMQIIAQLGDLYVKIDKIEWGLENPDSDSFLQWCEHYYLRIPSIDALAFIEVGDSHYYVNLVDDEGNGYGDGGETFRHWEDIAPYITELHQRLVSESKKVNYGAHIPTVTKMIESGEI